VSKLQKDVVETEAEGTRKAVQAKANVKTVEKLSKDMAKDGERRSSASLDGKRGASGGGVP
jgi:hypothetical protein